jgi:hypothetical protein
MGLGVELVQSPSKPACGLAGSIHRLHIQILRGFSDRSDERIERRRDPPGCHAPENAAVRFARNRELEARSRQATAIRE